MAASGSAAEWKKDPNSTDVAVSREDRAAMIVALLRERAGCEQRGLDARVKLIDAELARYGHEAAAPAKRAEKRPASSERVSR